MSAEENKTIMRDHFEEIWNKGNLAFVDENMAADMVSHDPRGPEPGLENFKQFVSMFRAAFPDMKGTVEDMLAEGDKVAARVTYSGTHTGEFQGIAPTNKQVTATLIGIFRIADGKIVEDWVLRDDLGFMEQLGVVPPPGQPEG